MVRICLRNTMTVFLELQEAWYPQVRIFQQRETRLQPEDREAMKQYLKWIYMRRKRNKKHLGGTDNSEALGGVGVVDS